MKLLVVEDEESLLQSIVEYFTQADFLCEGGFYQQEIERMEDFQYDCIILDINLPGGSGLELLKYLRKNKKCEGVITISARSSLDDKIVGRDLGVDDYLTKPFHLSELFARVKSLIRRKYASGSEILEVGKMKVDLLLKTVDWAGKQVVDKLRQAGFSAQRLEGGIQARKDQKGAITILKE